MTHEFNASSLDITKCNVCHRTVIDHICDGCGRGQSLAWTGKLLLCAECLEKESKIVIPIKERREELGLQPKIQEDTTIKILPDIFNANIASIEELRKQIEADESIENKNFALAELLDKRVKHLKQVIESAAKTISESSNETRAIQTYYNELAKKLRADEREKIKIQDVKYQPPAKPVTPIKAPSVKKYDKAAVREAAQKSGLPEAAIQMLCVAKNISPMDAVHILRGAGA